jgi:hypothetical protein
MKKIFTFCVAAILLNAAIAQNIGINNSDPKAALDLNGGLRTRVLTLSVAGTAVTIPANKSFIWLEGSPAAGFNITINTSYTEGSRLVVYNGTSKEGFIAGAESVFPGKITEMIFLDGEWRSIGTNNTVSQWNLTGNSGTDTAFNFIGTTDDKPLFFKFNNVQSGRISNESTSFGYGSMKFFKRVGVNRNTAIGRSTLAVNIGFENTAIGDYAMSNDSSGSENVAIGASALSNNRGANYGNVAVGNEALKFNANIENTAVGSSSMMFNTGGSANAAFGAKSMLYNITGSGNTALGAEALIQNRRGNFSVAIGYHALGFDTAANEIVAIGREALTFNNNKIGNTAVGTFALSNNSAIFNSPLSNTEAIQNTAIGHTALTSNTRGSGAVAIGYQAAYSDTSAHGMIAIGRAALYNNIGKTGNVAIGDSALFSNSLDNTIDFQGLNNTAIGHKTLAANKQGSNNTAIGFQAATKSTFGSGNTAIGSNSLGLNTTGRYNTSIGSDALSENVSGQYSTAVGMSALKNSTRSSNTSVGYASGFQNATGTGNVFLGEYAGYIELGSDKLYIENSINTKDGALIYGDFAADSLLLNGKTVIKNNEVVRGYTKLGGYDADVPSIKMKKISVAAGPAVNAVQSYPLGSGITDDKVVGIQVLMNYAGTWKIPPGYIDATGYEYNVQVQNNNIVVVLKSGNSANIGGKPISVIVTYEE